MRPITEATATTSLHARGNLELVDADRQLVAPVLAPKRPALDEIPQRFLEEERIAARAGDEEVRDALGKLGLRDGERFVPFQGAELELAVAVRVALSRELAELPGPVFPLAPVEEHECDRIVVRDRKQFLEELEGRLVCPVQVFQDEAERLIARKCGNELVEGLERLALNAVAGELADLLGKIRLERNSQERGEEGISVLSVVVQPCERGLQLETSARLGIGDPQAEPVAEHVAHRPVGEAFGVRGAVSYEEADLVREARSRLRDEP